MPRGTPSKGKCIFCQKEFPKTSLTRHLNTHLAEKTTGGKPGKSFHIKFETNPRWGSTPYFLHLWINGNTTMDEIDYFLRQIWLNCCGHMSAFRMPRPKHPVMPGAQSLEKVLQAIIKGNSLSGVSNSGEIAMNKKTKDVFHKDLKLEYQYDFGSTTELQLTVLEEYNIAADKPLVLLSRNEHPKWKCDMCGKETATQLCTVCTDDIMFCPACAKKHAKKCSDFADYAAMPVVNSPRMGVCSYEGGRIDKERD